MKTKLLAFLLLMLISCSGPKALITDRNGEVTLAKKLKSDGEPLLFRRDGFTSVLALKKLSSISVLPETSIYDGDTWNAVIVVYKKDEKQTPYKGWIKSTFVLNAKCSAGDCQFQIPSLTMVDLLMESSETPAPAEPDSAE